MGGKRDGEVVDEEEEEEEEEAILGVFGVLSGCCGGAIADGIVGCVQVKRSTGWKALKSLKVFWGADDSTRNWPFGGVCGSPERRYSGDVGAFLGGIRRPRIGIC